MSPRPPSLKTSFSLMASRCFSCFVCLIPSNSCALQSDSTSIVLASELQVPELIIHQQNQTAASAAAQLQKKHRRHGRHHHRQHRRNQDSSDVGSSVASHRRRSRSQSSAGSSRYTDNEDGSWSSYTSTSRSSCSSWDSKSDSDVLEAANERRALSDVEVLEKITHHIKVPDDKRRTLSDEPERLQEASTEVDALRSEVDALRERIDQRKAKALEEARARAQQVCMMMCSAVHCM